MTRRLAKTKTVLAVVAALATMALGTTPAAFAQEAAGEIAVTGVVSYEGTKADGTPVYGIKDEAGSTLPKTSQRQGYLLEGDYSAYVGQRITVYGKPEIDAGHRILDVSRIEE